MSDSKKKSVLPRNGCRRSEIERRTFSYSIYVPERRSGKERRCARETAKTVKAKGMRYRRRPNFA